MENLSLSRVQELVSHSRGSPYRPGQEKEKARIVRSLAIAIRSAMPRAGWAEIDAYQDDDYAEAENQYRHDTEQEAPIFETSKLRAESHWYMWDEVRGPLRAALELHLPDNQRSSGAKSLESFLHLGDEGDYEYWLFKAREKLLEIHSNVKPMN